MQHLSEHQHAVLFANWLRSEWYFFHHSPNETFTKFHNVRQKNTLEGVSKSFPDYAIILKRWSLLFIELKKAHWKNEDSMAQKSRQSKQFGFLSSEILTMSARISLMDSRRQRELWWNVRICNFSSLIFIFYCCFFYKKNIMSDIWRIL